MATGRAGDEDPLAEIAFQLGRAYPQVPLDNVVAAARQAKQDAPTADQKQLLERAKLILRAGQDGIN